MDPCPRLISACLRFMGTCLWLMGDCLRSIGVCVRFMGASPSFIGACQRLTHRRRGTFTLGGAMTLILPTNFEVYLNITYTNSKVYLYCYKQLKLYIELARLLHDKKEVGQNFF